MSRSSPEISARVATAADIEAIVATITTAFFDDPLWGPAFPDVERRAGQASALWRLFVTSSLRYPCTLVTERAESVAVWIPPDGTELTAEEEHGYHDFLVEIVGATVAGQIVAISEQFEQTRPSEPHHYLSLFATHSDHRGAGLGMALLRESLARVDDLGSAAYLESSNPANLERYRSVGFAARSELTFASGHVVTTMWRPPRWQHS